MASSIFKVALVTSLCFLSACNQVPPGFVWGDDSSQWANDGDCDDPRFDGPGAYSLNLAGDVMRDATDCQRLFNAGRVFLRRDFEPGVNYENPDYVRQTLKQSAIKKG